MVERESRKTVTVSYKTADGTALAGEDYTTALTELEFTSGVTAQTISVATTARRRLTARHSRERSRRGAGDRQSATGTIDDNDGERR